MRNSCLKYAVDIWVAIGKEEGEFWKSVREDKDFWWFSSGPQYKTE